MLPSQSDVQPQISDRRDTPREGWGNFRYYGRRRHINAARYPVFHAARLRP